MDSEASGAEPPKIVLVLVPVLGLTSKKEPAVEAGWGLGYVCALRPVIAARIWITQRHGSRAFLWSRVRTNR